MAEPILEFRSIARSYRRGTPVLQDVSFEVNRREVVALLGRNGTGKTTLIRLAMGLLHPHGGEVRVFGRDPATEPVTVRRRIGYVSEEQIFPASSTAQELLNFHRTVYPDWDATLESELADRFCLRRHASIHTLSKGQARQVALVCAMAHRPELLILDEPAGGLDPAARRSLLEASMDLLKREGTAILFSSHHMTDVERVADRVVFLEHGMVRLNDTLANLRQSVCVAEVGQAGVTVEALQQVPGCLRIRPAGSAWHAVFRGDPREVGQAIEHKFPGAVAECKPVELEDLFVELLGDRD